jgi:hypothetical protein
MQTAKNKTAPKGIKSGLSLNTQMALYQKTRAKPAVAKGPGLSTTIYERRKERAKKTRSQTQASVFVYESGADTLPPLAGVP